MTQHPVSMTSQEKARAEGREEQLKQAYEMALAIVKAIAENRGQEILLLDVTQQTSLFDYFAIATGSSRRQMTAISTEIERLMKSQFDERKLSISGVEDSRWIILDYGSIVVHLFDEDTRRFYDLESLWGDATELDITEIVASASSSLSRRTGPSET